MNYRYLFGLLVVMTLTLEVWCRGRLLEPPSRSSLWRYGFDGAEINLKDDRLNCGGFKVNKQYT